MGRKPLDPTIKIAKSWSGSSRPTPHHGPLAEQQRQAIAELARRFAVEKQQLAAASKKKR
jgi:hypothetical protein